MRNYSWAYGVFHWAVHYVLVVMLVEFSGVVIIPNSLSYTLFSIRINNRILDYIIVIVFTSIIDLDHLQVLMKFGFRNYIWAQKRLVSPLHNFFFLSALGTASAFSAIFISKTIAVVIFAVVTHLLWDMLEDVFIFRTSFRRWERTWGLNTKDIQETYNKLFQSESEQKK
jgi:hypothetical protein